MHTTPASFAPVSLSYVAALRGIKANHPGESFTYSLANCSSPELLIGLAASNPEGQFIGIVSDNGTCNKASDTAAERQVGNVKFICGTAASLLQSGSALPQLDYLVCDETSQVLTHLERTALFDLAAQKLKNGGIFNYNYRAYANGGETLKFLVREFGPEMSAEQATDFLLELKKLGTLYLKTNPGIAAKLDQAIVKGMPDEFFANFDQGEARSATFDTLVAMRMRNMSYVGAGQIEANYVELSVPQEAQSIIIECVNNPLYQPLKDFASNSAVRSDIWCKQPATMSSDPAELFGSFAYGIPMPADKVPASVNAFGKEIDLSSPLNKELITIMTMQPAGIGDILAHPDCANFTASQIIEAVQILVALGYARPMRGAREESNVGSLAQPRFCGGFNRFLDRVSVSSDALAMASRVMGDVVNVSPREVLVMQALNRAGLANSVSALLPELERLAKDPAASAGVTDIAEPTAETAHQMINEAVTQSIVQWYAYGLLEAA